MRNSASNEHYERCSNQQRRRQLGSRPGELLRSQPRLGGWRLLAGLILLLPAISASQLDVVVEDAGTALFDAAASVLATWIVESRNAAIGEGVERIPPAVRHDLSGYVPDVVLDRARWRVGGGGVLSLQRGLIGFGYAPAVTLDYVIVFETATDALDAKLWVHELRHVQQFVTLGVAGFVDQYLRDYNELETDAAEYRWAWMKQTGRVPPP